MANDAHCSRDSPDRSVSPLEPPPIPVELAPPRRKPLAPFPWARHSRSPGRHRRIWRRNNLSRRVTAGSAAFPFSLIN